MTVMNLDLTPEQWEKCREIVHGTCRGQSDRVLAQHLHKAGIFKGQDLKWHGLEVLTDAVIEGLNRQARRAGRPGDVLGKVPMC
jgi:hypothetical protein